MISGLSRPPLIALNVPCLGAGPLFYRPCALGQRPGSLGSVRARLFFLLIQITFQQMKKLFF